MHLPATSTGRKVIAMDDPRATERFIRVIGKRQRPPKGEPPPAEARRALATMADYRTCVPKGIFV